MRRQKSSGFGRVRTPLRAVLLAWLLALQPVGALPAQAAPGDLDLTFGTGGKVTTDFAGDGDLAFAVALQPDGKIVAAGRSSFDFALARYNADGSLDPTFGTGGKVTTDFGFDEAFAVALQPDGKIVAAGYAVVGSSLDFALARYNADGSLDPTFGTDGKVTTDFGNFDEALAMALPTGRSWPRGWPSSVRPPSTSPLPATCQTGPSTPPSARTAR